MNHHFADGRELLFAISSNSAGYIAEQFPLVTSDEGWMDKGILPVRAENHLSP